MNIRDIIQQVKYRDFSFIPERLRKKNTLVGIGAVVVLGLASIIMNWSTFFGSGGGAGVTGGTLPPAYPAGDPSDPRVKTDASALAAMSLEALQAEAITRTSSAQALLQGGGNANDIQAAFAAARRATEALQRKQEGGNSR